MSEKTRKFEVELSDDENGEIAFQLSITETDKAKAEIEEMVKFWRRWEKILDKYKGDYTKAFIYYFSITIEGAKEDLHSIEGVKDHFDGIEGFYPIFSSDWFKLGRFYNEYATPALGVEIKEI